MIRRPPRSTLFPYTTALPISLDQLHVVVDRLGVDLGAVHVGEPRQIVERVDRSEEHTSELQSPCNLVCRLLLEKKKRNNTSPIHQDAPLQDPPAPTRS